jgi:undecaprenyl-diphosphatase
MELFDIIALALIQGITEFLPISSSGHLALWPILSGRPDQGVTMDVAVHMGTLAAVCVYFRRDALQLLAGLADVLRGRVRTDSARLFLLVAIATTPAVIAGLALKLTGWIDALRVLEVIGWATLLGGLLLWYADRVGAQKRGAWGPDGGWGLHDAILMGLAQALALVPGTSRSGITMTMARWLGFGRTEAARLSGAGDRRAGEGRQPGADGGAGPGRGAVFHCRARGAERDDADVPPRLDDAALRDLPAGAGGGAAGDRLFLRAPPRRYAFPLPADTNSRAGRG